MKRNRLTILLFAALAFVLAACDTGNGSLPLPAASIADVTPVLLVPGEEVTVTGTGFYQTSATGLTRVEVCGVTLPATLVEPLSRNVILPPGGTVNVQVGSTLTFTVPEQGLSAEHGQLLTVIRPDGSTATSDAITCLVPDPEPEPIPVSAVITASATTAVAPAQIAFNAAGSTGEGELEYVWEFGHAGATSALVAPEFTYPEAGEFTVTLTVTDETDATDTATEVITVNPPLQAVIQHGEVTGFAPVTVSFDGTGSTGVQPLTYGWSFGLEGAISDEAVPVFEFESAGEYEVTLTVTEPGGATSTANVDLVIPAAVPAVAVIGESVTGGMVPLTVEFDAAGSSGQGDLTYEWDFGDDGATSMDAVASHTFGEIGSYTVTLTVTDEINQSDEATTVITVSSVPLVPVTISVNPDLDFSDVQFTIGNTDNGVELPVSSIGLPVHLPAGSYDLTVDNLEHSASFEDEAYTEHMRGDTFAFQVPAGATGVETGFQFVPVAGAVSIDVGGFPAGINPLDNITIEALHVTPLGPVPTAASVDLVSVTPGVYEITYADVYVDGVLYVPESRSVTYSVSSDETTVVPVNPYEVGQGTLELSAADPYSDISVNHSLEYRQPDNSWIDVTSADGLYPSLAAGTYRVDIFSTVVDHGSWVEEYYPLDFVAPPQFTLMPDARVTIDVGYGIAPSDGLSVDQVDGLEGGLEPSFAVLDPGDSLSEIPPGEWDSLPPGRYLVRLDAVERTVPDGITLHDDGTVDAHERFAPASSPIEVYLSSNLHSTFDAVYEFVPAALRFSVNFTDEGTDEGGLRLHHEGTTTLFNREHADNSNTDAGLGEYQVEVVVPDGYRILTSSGTPYLLANYSYGHSAHSGMWPTASVTFEPIPAPVARIDGPGVVNSGEEVTFSAAASTGVGGLSYEWFINDTVASSAASLTHTFGGGGPANVVLTVTDGYGQSDTVQLTVDVWVPVTFRTTPSDLYIESLPIRTSSESGNLLITPDPGPAPLMVYLPVARYPQVHELQDSATARRTVTHTVDGTVFDVNEHYVASHPVGFSENTGAVSLPIGEFFGSPHMGSVNISVSGLPGMEEPVYELMSWDGSSWIMILNPGFDAMPPGVYELRPNAVNVPVDFNDGGATFTAEPVLFTVDSNEETPVQVDYTLAQPVPTFTFSPENPVAGELVTFDGSGTLGAPGKTIYYGLLRPPLPEPGRAGT